MAIDVNVVVGGVSSERSIVTGNAIGERSLDEHARGKSADRRGDQQRLVHLQGIALRLDVLAVKSDCIGLYAGSMATQQSLLAGHEVVRKGRRATEDREREQSHCALPAAHHRRPFMRVDGAPVLYDDVRKKGKRSMCVGQLAIAPPPQVCL